MSPTSLVSVAASAVSLLLGIAAAALSRGPGGRALRWYAAASLLAGLFALGNLAVVAEHVTALTVERAARFTLAVAGLHGASWLAYDVAEEERPPRSYEWALIGGSVVFAAASLVPGLLVSNVVATRTAWFGIVYRDALPTSAGIVAYAYYCWGLAILAVRNARRVREGHRQRLPHLVGLVILVMAAILDSLAAAQVTRLPYVLDVAFLVVVMCVGASLGHRFLETARALEESSAKLASAQAELVQRERLAAVGEMAAVVAHEVRNPLAVMFNALTGLRRALRTGEARGAEELVAILQEEADRLRRLVDDFLDFARPLSLRRATTEVVPLLEEAVAAARAAAPSQHRVHLARASIAGVLHCDAQLVRLAIVNLVVNALQLEGAAMTIEVTARADANRLVVSVVDRGAGVPASEVPRLFEPFFTTRARGTGLGLTIVRRIAEAHGGTTRHSATPGGGATFVLELPLAGLGPLPGGALDSDGSVAAGEAAVHTMNAA